MKILQTQLPTAAFDSTWRTALALVFLLAVTAVTFDTLLSIDRVPIYRDSLFFTLPFKHFLASAFRQGELPLWNPWILMGTPFLGNWQSAVFYPLSGLLLLPLPTGFNLFILAHYVVALVGSWLWLRERGSSRTAVAIGVMVFTLGGYLVSLLNLVGHLQSAVWAPWVFLYWERYARRRRRSDFAGLVVSLAMQFLGGTPEGLVATLTIVVAWTVYRSGREWRALVALATSLSTALVLVAGICAIQLLPTLESIAQSARVGSMTYDEVTNWSMQPVSLLQLLFPHSSALLPAADANSLGPAFESSLALIQSYYIGIAPLCLAIVGAACGRERSFWAAMVLFAVLLSLGSHTPVFSWFYDHAPFVFGRFRYPEKFYFVAHIGAAVLAAEGVDCLIHGNTSAQKVARAAILTFLIVGLTFYVLRWWMPQAYLDLIAILSGKFLPATAFVSLALDTYRKVQRLLLMLSILGALLLLRPSAVRPFVANLLLVALVAIDLASTHRNLNLDTSWSELMAKPPILDIASARSSGTRIFHYQTITTGDESAGGSSSPRLARWVHSISSGDDLARVYRDLWSALYANGGMIYGVPEVSGGEGLGRLSDNWLFESLRHLSLQHEVSLLRLYGTGYLIGPDLLSAEGLKETRPHGTTPYHVYEVVHPMPFAFAVSRLREAATPVSALSIMTADGFRPEEEAVVSQIPAGWSDAPDTTAEDAVSLVGRSMQSIKIDVRSTHALFLVINSSYFPGWKAMVNGSPAQIYPTNAIVSGVVVPPGTNRLELMYDPTSLRVGAALSLVTLLLAGLVAARAR